MNPPPEGVKSKVTFVPEPMAKPLGPYSKLTKSMPWLVFPIAFSPKLSELLAITLDGSLHVKQELLASAKLAIRIKEKIRVNIFHSVLFIYTIR